MPTPEAAAPLATATIRQLLQDGCHALAGEQGRLEAELLLAHALDRPRTHLHAWPERVIEAEAADHYRTLLERRAGGEPLAYITGWREFWSLKLQVTPAVLIPRPETELLVELALEQIPLDRPTRVVDLGTGSGAIAAAIANERPNCQVTAVETDSSALAVAQGNFDRLGLRNVKAIQGNWCASLGETEFDLMVGNPPYVAQADPHLRRGDPACEPRHALAAGVDGLDAIRRIARQAGTHLPTHGRLLLEHGYDQGTAVRAILHDRGFRAVHTHRDLAGLERVTAGTWA